VTTAEGQMRNQVDNNQVKKKSHKMDLWLRDTRGGNKLMI
jgi:hypothetical protein